MDGIFLTSCRHWWERVNSTVKEFHPSNTSGSSREQTRAARLIDRDANDCAISPPLSRIELAKLEMQDNNNNSETTWNKLHFGV